jgi:TonB dependent receptor/Carboxypeptidase regulatory-like domain
MFLIGGGQHIGPLSRGAVLAILMAAPAAGAERPAGGLLGYVEDDHGSPLAGAIVSVFGRGVGGAGLVTLSDSAGRFFVPSLPAGPYTLRALRDGHTPAPARRIFILPNQDATFTINLTPVTETSTRESEVKGARDDTAALRELQWLIRHKRRSALEDHADGPPASEASANKETPPGQGLLASLLPDLAGTVQLVTSSMGQDVADETEPSSWSVVRLNGRIADSGHWSLNGLVAEHESATWRVAGDFVFEPGGGHQVQLATGYGTRALRPLAVGRDQVRLDRGVGAVSFQDRWQATEHVATTLGGRYSYSGFLEQSNHFDPTLGFEYRRDEKTRVRGSVRAQTLVPGGDVLTVSTVSSAPAVAFAVLDSGLRPEHVRHYELGVDQQLGGGLSVEAHTFYEAVHDQLVNQFDTTHAPHSLHVSNGAWLASRGMGVRVSRRFGDVVHGSMTYTYGHGWRHDLGATTALFAFRDGDFHDLAARVETIIEGTDTRVVAFCRLNRLSGDLEHTASAVTNTRFDVQLSQGLPFLGALTRADWDVLVAVRNLFYEASEGGTLDEMAVAHPPTRVLGGISVRF